MALASPFGVKTLSSAIKSAGGGAANKIKYENVDIYTGKTYNELLGTFNRPTRTSEITGKYLTNAMSTNSRLNQVIETASDPKAQIQALTTSLDKAAQAAVVYGQLISGTLEELIQDPVLNDHYTSVGVKSIIQVCQAAVLDFHKPAFQRLKELNALSGISKGAVRLSQKRKKKGRKY